MTVSYCDRCGAELPSDKKHASVRGSADMTAKPAPVVTHAADLCTKCYRQVWEFVLPKPKKGART